MPTTHQRITRRLLAAITCALLFSGTVQAAEKQPVMVNIKRMSLDTALTAAQASIETCREEGVQVSVTIVDRGGHPQVVLRDVLAMDVSLPISRDKAYTAMSFNTPTGDLEGRFTGAYSVPKTPGLLIVRGGLPITAAGSIFGGIGVSGAPSGEVDEKCAQAGLDAIQDDLEMSVE
ncbi:MAG: heme-binding protein [Gammaproteobacteria bacterium]|nr:heme-binding protein [Gammaproteobacteria bacterium]